MLLRAFAKINLSLSVLGRRPDGFHELRTIFQAIDWHDEVEMQPAAGFRFSADAGPEDETNLVVRAVRAFERETGRPARVAVALRKRVPSGAGLGGGSADAAVTFLGLQRLYGMTVPAARTLQCLREIGSDVPFFCHGGRAEGRGRGDEIVRMEDDTGYALVLVDPAIVISTAAAYSWLTGTGKSNNIVGFRAEFVPDQKPGIAQNDFETPVFSRFPELEEIRNELLRFGAFKAALSGSGSVVYGQFDTIARAERAAAGLGERYSVRMAQPLSRNEYFSRMVSE